MLRSGLTGLTILLVALGSTGAADHVESREALTQRRDAEARFKRENPAVMLYKRGPLTTRAFGATFSEGGSIVDSAEKFRARHAGMFGVEAGDLRRKGHRDGEPMTQPVMYLPESGTYKFTLVRYPQSKHGFPVFRSELKLLVRNVPGHPVVWAGSSLRPLAGVDLDAELRGRAARNDVVAERFAAVRQIVSDAKPDLSYFTEPEVVVWAGLDDEVRAPRLALAFEANNFVPGGRHDENWLYVTDFATGEVLYREDRIMDLVSGSVQGLKTDGDGSDQCEPESAAPLPYLRLTSGAETTFSDENGEFSFATGGATVEATLDGMWFDVSNVQGPEIAESEPSSFDLLFNSSNADELVRAQVNGYVEANRIRDFVAGFNPDYPTFTDTDILVRVNRTDGFCPGNAWYSEPDPGSASGYSINFCSSSANRPNTAWSSIVHHEFGHHLVNAAGSGQGQYGEGTGDVMSVVILDSPAIGRGFFNDCGGSLRTADNDFQYPCFGASHTCGNLISGCVWSTRNKLADTNPTSYREILGNLAVNAILLHTGSTITPAITVDYLTLDDDDGVLLNGTPHFDEIDAGFGAHNMPGPSREFGLAVSPKQDLLASGPSGGAFTPEALVYTLHNAETIALDYEVVANQPWISVGNGSGTLPPNGTASVTIALNAAAQALGSGLYEADVSFVNLTDHLGDRMQSVVLAVDNQSFSSTDTPLVVPRVATSSSSIAIGDGFCVGDVDVVVDLSHGSIEDLAVDLQAPSGVVVRLHDGQSAGVNLVRRYDDETSVPAEGPGTLSDFDFGSAAGTWTLTIENASLTDGATLNGWSLELSQLGAVCPPRANPLQVLVPDTSPVDVVLDGQTGSGAALDYVITSLPNRGGLSDPSGGTIAVVPYTLVGGGNVVSYAASNGYVGPDAFGYKVNDGVDSDNAAVELQVGPRQLVAGFDMSGDPGWSATGEWAYGQPTGGGTHAGDPTSGFTGGSVYGYNLAGDYADNMAAETLTSGPIDCSDFVGVEVAFRRWLGVESAAFDRAEFQVSNDGASWATVWTHDGTTLDESSWTRHAYDVSEIADGQPTLFLRWVMGSSDSSEAYAGWNIDDVEVSGVMPPPGVELTVERSGLFWSALPGGTAYDVVRGDLATLRSTRGDYLTATDACVGDDVGSTTLTFADDPAPGQGAWILVRGATPPAPTTYDSYGESQLGLRDDGINASAVTCP